MYVKACIETTDSVESPPDDYQKIDLLSQTSHLTAKAGL
jgi:hypothetical protein